MRWRTTGGITVACAAALALAACSSGQDTQSGPQTVKKKSGHISISYLQKQGDQQYFVDEANGAKAEAGRLGNVTVNVVNLALDSDKAISAMDTAVARKSDGIAMVAPDQKIGPQVIDKARQANIPFVASDDVLKDGTGKEVPFVGFDGTSMGRKVGAEAAKLYKKAGWTAADTRIVAAWKQDLSVCTQRVDGAAAAFGQAVGTDVPKTIKLGTDNTPTDAQNKAGAMFNANSGVKHWIVWGCNDENTTGVVTALQNAKVAPDDIIGVGLGAYLTCKDWKAGQDSGNKAALFINGEDVGALAVRDLVTSLRSGKPMPPKTIAPTQMVDATNWKKAGVKCT